MIWYARLKYLGPQNIVKLAKVFKGITFKRKREDNNYYIDSEVYYYYYASGKFIFRLYKSSIKLNKVRLDLIYSDITGPISPNRFNKARYYISFRDDFSRIFKIYPIARKSKVFEKFRYFKAKYERNNRKIRRFRFDNSKEYISTAFNKYLKDCGINSKPITRDSLEQNPISERLNREIGERTKTTISSEGLPKNLWPEIVKTVNYLVMRELNTRLKGITPYEA